MSLNRTFLLRRDLDIASAFIFIRANWLAFSKTKTPLEITVAPQKIKRSLDQNKRLHAIISEIADQAWLGGHQFSTEAWREYYKREYIGVEEIILPDGDVITRGISTTTLDVAAFSDLTDKIQADAVERLGVIFSQ